MKKSARTSRTAQPDRMTREARLERRRTLKPIASDVDEDGVTAGAAPLDMQASVEGVPVMEMKVVTLKKHVQEMGLKPKSNLKADLQRCLCDHLRTSPVSGSANKNSMDRREEEDRSLGGENNISDMPPSVDGVPIMEMKVVTLRKHVRDMDLKPKSHLKADLQRCLRDHLQMSPVSGGANNYSMNASEAEGQDQGVENNVLDMPPSVNGVPVMDMKVVALRKHVRDMGLKPKGLLKADLQQCLCDHLQVRSRGENEARDGDAPDGPDRKSETSTTSKRPAKGELLSNKSPKEVRGSTSSATHEHSAGTEDIPMEVDGGVDEGNEDASSGDGNGVHGDSGPLKGAGGGSIAREGDGRFGDGAGDGKDEGRDAGGGGSGSNEKKYKNSALETENEIEGGAEQNNDNGNAAGGADQEACVEVNQADSLDSHQGTGAESVQVSGADVCPPVPADGARTDDPLAATGDSVVCPMSDDSCKREVVDALVEEKVTMEVDDDIGVDSNAQYSTQEVPATEPSLHPQAEATLNPRAAEAEYDTVEEVDTEGEEEVEEQGDAGQSEGAAEKVEHSRIEAASLPCAQGEDGVEGYTGAEAKDATVTEVVTESLTRRKPEADDTELAVCGVESEAYVGDMLETEAEGGREAAEVVGEPGAEVEDGIANDAESAEIAEARIAEPSPEGRLEEEQDLGEQYNVEEERMDVEADEEDQRNEDEGEEERGWGQQNEEEEEEAGDQDIGDEETGGTEDAAIDLVESDKDRSPGSPPMESRVHRQVHPRDEMGVESLTRRKPEADDAEIAVCGASSEVENDTYVEDMLEAEGGREAADVMEEAGAEVEDEIANDAESVEIAEARTAEPSPECRPEEKQDLGEQYNVEEERMDVEADEEDQRNEDEGEEERGWGQQNEEEEEEAGDQDIGDEETGGTEDAAIDLVESDKDRSPDGQVHLRDEMVVESLTERAPEADDAEIAVCGASSGAESEADEDMPETEAEDGREAVEEAGAEVEDEIANDAESAEIPEARTAEPSREGRLEDEQYDVEEERMDVEADEEDQRNEDEGEEERGWGQQNEEEEETVDQDIGDEGTGGTEDAAIDDVESDKEVANDALMMNSTESTVKVHPRDGMVEFEALLKGFSGEDEREVLDFLADPTVRPVDPSLPVLTPEQEKRLANASSSPRDWDADLILALNPFLGQARQILRDKGGGSIRGVVPAVSREDVSSNANVRPHATKRPAFDEHVVLRDDEVIPKQPRSDTPDDQCKPTRPPAPDVAAPPASPALPRGTGPVLQSGVGTPSVGRLARGSPRIGNRSSGFGERLPTWQDSPSKPVNRYKPLVFTPRRRSRPSFSGSNRRDDSIQEWLRGPVGDTDAAVGDGGASGESGMDRPVEHSQGSRCQVAEPQKNDVPGLLGVTPPLTLSTIEEAEVRAGTVEAETAGGAETKVTAEVGSTLLSMASHGVGDAKVQEEAGSRTAGQGRVEPAPTQNVGLPQLEDGTSSAGGISISAEDDGERNAEFGFPIRRTHRVHAATTKSKRFTFTRCIPATRSRTSLDEGADSQAVVLDEDNCSGVFEFAIVQCASGRRTRRRALVKNAKGVTVTTAPSLTPVGSDSGYGATRESSTLPPQVPTAKGFDMSLFKKPGEWKCEACLVKNPPERDICLSCETAKPMAGQGDAVGPGASSVAPVPTPTIGGALFAGGAPSSTQTFTFGSQS